FIINIARNVIDFTIRKWKRFLIFVVLGINILYTMKILIFLLSISFSASACGARDNAKDKEVLMKKKDIIQWVNDNNVKRVKACLEKGVDVNMQDQNGRNLLLLATINNQNEMAELLVENGADVN